MAFCLVCADSSMSNTHTNAFKSVENLARKVDEAVRRDCNKRWY
jgi:hypothetical protein